MRIGKHVVLAIFASIICFSTCSILTAFAQSSDAALQPVVSLPAHMTSGPVPGGIISGYVFDEDGMPVSDAIVSLWQYGRLVQDQKYVLWQTGKKIINNSFNPQTTNIPNQGMGYTLTEGSFQFGYLYPGEYSLMVEKDGYKNSSVSVQVGNETMSPSLLDTFNHSSNEIMVNVTLNGYHVLTFSPEQLSYTGAVAGTLRTANGGYTYQANMSLWRDGRMVDMLDNPQASFVRHFSDRTVDYVFEHLAPGHYTVLAEYYSGDGYKNNISVDVGSSTVNGDMVLDEVIPQRPPWTNENASPTMNAVGSGGPTSTGSMPAPALSWLVAILAMGVVALYILKKRDER